MSVLTRRRLAPSGNSPGESGTFSFPTKEVTSSFPVFPNQSAKYKNDVATNSTNSLSLAYSLYILPMEEGEEKVAPAITRNRFDEILTLLDLYWFHHLILSYSPPPPTAPPPALSGLHAEPPSLSPQPIRHRRTRSNESISTFFPCPVKPPRLQTIPSGKISLNPIQSSQLHEADMDAMEKKRPRIRLSRSMSELELEELKGLMDLGFNFSDTEVERNPKIADIVPGLRKRRSEGEVKVARRPYLSEAWRFIDVEEKRRVLRDWSVLTNGDEKHVKEQLRRWAHVVASTVR